MHLLFTFVINCAFPHNEACTVTNNTLRSQGRGIFKQINVVEPTYVQTVIAFVARFFILVSLSININMYVLYEKLASRLRTCLIGFFHLV